MRELIQNCCDNATTVVIAMKHHHLWEMAMFEHDGSDFLGNLRHGYVVVSNDKMTYATATAE